MKEVIIFLSRWLSSLCDEVSPSIYLLIFLKYFSHPLYLLKKFFILSLYIYKDFTHLMIPLSSKVKHCTVLFIIYLCLLTTLNRSIITKETGRKTDTSIAARIDTDCPFQMRWLFACASYGKADKYCANAEGFLRLNKCQFQSGCSFSSF